MLPNEPVEMRSLDIENIEQPSRVVRPNIEGIALIRFVARAVASGVAVEGGVMLCHSWRDSRVPLVTRYGAEPGTARAFTVDLAVQAHAVDSDCGHKRPPRWDSGERV